MDDEEYEIAQQFFNEVREAYWRARHKLGDEKIDEVIYYMQDGLSLFSPWMNNDPNLKDD